MAKGKDNVSPRINNRRALHEFFIDAKLECGIALVGSEVKSLRAGKAQLQDAFAKILNGELFLMGAHIDPYEKAAIAYNHEPRRDRKLLVHKRELKKLAGEADQRGVTLIPLAIYFKGGRAKVEIGVARGKQQFDKRATIKKKEMDREVRRAMSHKG
jgi:SsrA-binding protein